MLHMIGPYLPLGTHFVQVSFVHCTLATLAFCSTLLALQVHSYLTGFVSPQGLLSPQIFTCKLPSQHSGLNSETIPNSTLPKAAPPNPLQSKSFSTTQLIFILFIAMPGPEMILPMDVILLPISPQLVHLIPVAGTYCLFNSTQAVRADTQGRHSVNQTA